MTKFADQASPIIAQACQTGRQFSAAVIDFVDPATKLATFRLELKDVLVSSFQPINMDQKAGDKFLVHFQRCEDERQPDPRRYSRQSAEMQPGSRTPEARVPPPSSLDTLTVRASVSVSAGSEPFGMNASVEAFSCWRLVRAGGAGLDPGLDQRARLLLRAGSGLAAESGRPGPADQVVVADVLDEASTRAGRRCARDP